jgi:hypothetical protein
VLNQQNEIFGGNRVLRVRELGERAPFRIDRGGGQNLNNFGKVINLTFNC